jgi:hypothetical protein
MRMWRSPFSVKWYTSCYMSTRPPVLWTFVNVPAVPKILYGCVIFGFCKFPWKRICINTRCLQLNRLWVSIVTKLRVAWPRFDSRQGKEIFLFATASRPPLGPIQPPIQCVAWALSQEVKRPGREAYVKNAWSYTSTPHTSSWRCT